MEIRFEGFDRRIDKIKRFMEPINQLLSVMGKAKRVINIKILLM